MCRRFFSLSLGEVSRHRALLYGFAALWVLFYHMEFPIPNHPLMKPVEWFKIRGNSGVDLFLLLSGFGLYGSLSRNGSVREFYRRRMVRVFLPTFIVTAVHFGLKACGEGQYVLKLMAFPFWLGVGMFWYAPFILTMYLVYPLIFHLQRRAPKALWVLLLGSMAFPMVFALAFQGRGQGLERAFSRIPTFILGCMIAPAVLENRRISLGWLPVTLIAHIALSFSGGWPFYRYGQIALAAFFIMALTLIAPWLTQGGLRRFVYRFVAMLGGVSLELYLIQIRLAEWLALLPAYASGGDGRIKLELFCLIATILLSLMLKALCNLVVREFEKTKIPEIPKREEE